MKRSLRIEDDCDNDMNVNAWYYFQIQCENEQVYYYTFKNNTLKTKKKGE